MQLTRPSRLESENDNHQTRPACDTTEKLNAPLEQQPRLANRLQPGSQAAGHRAEAGETRRDPRGDPPRSRARDRTFLQTSVGVACRSWSSGSLQYHTVWLSSLKEKGGKESSLAGTFEASRSGLACLPLYRRVISTLKKYTKTRLKRHIYSRQNQNPKIEVMLKISWLCKIKTSTPRCSYHQNHNAADRLHHAGFDFRFDDLTCSICLMRRIFAHHAWSDSFLVS
jgi:hypothetical protein